MAVSCNVFMIWTLRDAHPRRIAAQKPREGPLPVIDVPEVVG